MGTARLIGYDASGHVVYSEILDLGEYYDGEHVWDTSEGILGLRLVRLIGELCDGDRRLQVSETRFSAETGDLIGSIGVHEDGQVTRYGDVSEGMSVAFLSHVLVTPEEPMADAQMILPL